MLSFVVQIVRTGTHKAPSLVLDVESDHPLMLITPGENGQTRRTLTKASDLRPKDVIVLSDGRQAQVSSISTVDRPGLIAPPPDIFDEPVSGVFIGRSAFPQVQSLNSIQHEVCEILQEECNELGQAASKLKRCGQGFVADDGKKLTARERFSVEVADVIQLLSEAHAVGLIDYDMVRRTLRGKPGALRVWTKYLGHAPQVFPLPDETPA